MEIERPQREIEVAWAALQAAMAATTLRQSLPPPAARRQLREQAGIPRRLIADVCGVTPQAVRNWELGRKFPAGEHLVKYASVLDCLRDSTDK